MPWATGKAAHWRGDRTRTTLWEIANNNPFGNQNHAQSWGHGTQKPVECMRRPIVNNSRPGQAIYDPFLGSGTSLIAAEMSARICYGLELNPVYVDVIVRRPQLFTGRAALHHFWQSFFLTGHPVLATLWGPIVGPLVAVISFVCSVGNIPLAAVLWNGSISFGGVVAFIFADLIPEVGASLSLDQLRGDAHSPAGLAHRALEQIAHAQFADNPPDVDRLPLVRKTRTGSDDKQPADAGERGDYLLDHAVGEVLLLRIAAQVLEWQHRNRRLVGQGERGSLTIRLLQDAGMGA
jgi:hypothetical protein